MNKDQNILYEQVKSHTLKYSEEIEVEKSEITDIYNRTFQKLRISLTNQCNLSCQYCVSGKNEHPSLNNLKYEISRPLSPDEIFKIVQSIHELCNLTSIKLTGGEPLLYPGINELIERIKTLSIDKISITTNGFFLKHMAESFYKSGIKSINVSLDAATPEIFKMITNKDAFTKVIDGIKAAVDSGIKVKLNAVILKGINDGQIIPLLDLAKYYHVEIRFLELMKMGYLYHKKNDLFFSEEEILSVIRRKCKIQRLQREKHSTSNYWMTEAGIKFGIIANESSPFCKDCDRLRLDSSGRIYGCISDESGIDFTGCLDDKAKMILLLKKALSKKQVNKFKGSPVSMIQIGG